MKKNLFLLLLAFFAKSVFASHFMGLDMTYEQISPNVYRIYHAIYIDCAGAASSSYVQPVSMSNPFPAPMITASAVGCTPPALTNSWNLVNFSEVTPIAPGTTTQCSDSAGTMNGAAQALYYMDYDITSYSCASSADIVLSWTNCCRNYVITSGADGTSMSMNTCTIKTGISNSSPSFLTYPVLYICAGQPSIYSQGASDIDGDSLTYIMGSCYSSASSTVPYTAAGGYSPSSPLGAGWDVSIDPQTGDIDFIPVNGGGGVAVGVLCVYITEWRNGIQIGQVARDIQVTVLANCNNINPSIKAISNVQGANVNTYNGVANRLTGYMGVPLSFEIPTDDPDIGQEFTLSWDERVSGATFYDVNNPNVVNSIPSVTPPTAKFEWTPATAGQYIFTVTMSDNYVGGLRGMMQRSYIIDVMNTSTALTTANTNTVITACNTADFSATPAGGVPPFTYQWSGDIPASNAASFSNTFATSGTYNYTVLVTDFIGQSITENGSITFVAPTTPNAGLDAAVCVQQTATLGTTGLPGYTYLWTSNPPNTGFTSGNNASQITVGIPSNNVVTSVDYTLTATDIYGCVSATDVVHVDFGGQITGNLTMQTNGNITTFSLTPTGFIGQGTYQWTISGASVAGSGSSINVPNLSGVIVADVIATDDANCSASFTQIFNVTGIASMPNAFANCSLSPVPSKDKITLQFYATETSDFSATWFDVNGKKLKQETLYAITGNNEKTLSMEGLSAGYYFLHIQNEKGSTVLKAIKE